MSKNTKKKASAKAPTNKQVKNSTKKRKTQEDIVLAHLKRCSKKGITSMEAFSKYHITRLSAKVFTLRKQGYEILTIREANKETGTHYGRYVLVGGKDDV